MNVLMITSEWPTPENPSWVPFLVREVTWLKTQGVRIDLFPFRGGMKPGNYFRFWMQVQRKLHRQNHDLVHAQFGQSGVLAALPKTIPLVVTLRGSDLNGIIGYDGKLTTTGWLLRKTSQWVARRADEIILVSQQLARFLPSNQHYTVIPSGLDLKLFHPMPQEEARQALSLPRTPRYVLFAGNPNNPIKRFHLAEKAVSRLEPDLNAQLLIAKGVPPEKMPLYMNAADALLLTSSREGSPNVVKEALACNLPVVSVDVGDVRQHLTKVSGCLVCTNDDPMAIADGLASILASPNRVAGRQAISHLDLSHTTQQIVSVYEKALARA